MKKKILLCLLLVLCLFTVVGCKKTKEPTKKTSQHSEELNKKGEIDIYSDDEKIVFESGKSLLVFYYKGDKITAYHTYIDYETEETAKIALEATKKTELVKDVYTKGKYLVIEYNDDHYSKFTVKDIKEAYSYLNERTK